MDRWNLFTEITRSAESKDSPPAASILQISIKQITFGHRWCVYVYTCILSLLAWERYSVAASRTEIDTYQRNTPRCPLLFLVRP